MKKKTIQSVLGNILIEKLGITLSHEHLIINTCNWWQEPPDSRWDKYIDGDIDMEGLDLIHRGPTFSRSNLVLEDKEQAIKELSYFKSVGGVSLVDLTPIGVGRDPIILKKISEATGINIICGTAYYVQASHPNEVAMKSVEELSGKMISEIETGIQGTGVRAAVLGENGVSPAGIQPDEEKVLRAAAKAHKETMAPIAVHTVPPTPEKIPTKVLDLLEGLNVDPRHVALCHLDWWNDTNYLAELAERGAFVSLDCFGSEFPWCMYSPPGGNKYKTIVPTDYERALIVKELLKLGLGDRILMSHDIGTKRMIKRYGGWGYDHILRNVRKIFEVVGIDEKEFMKIMVDNPRAFFE